VGNLSPGLKTVGLTRDDVTITMRNVPVLVCDTCEKAATTAAVTANLHKISEAGFAAGTLDIEYTPPAG
jgi:hypothetical protein